MFWEEKNKRVIKGGWGVGGSSIRHLRVSTKFKNDYFEFLVQINTKRVFPNRKNENYHRVLHIEINLDCKFQLQPTVLMFGPNFQKTFTESIKK